MDARFTNRMGSCFRIRARITEVPRMRGKHRTWTFSCVGVGKVGEFHYILDGPLTSRREREWVVTQVIEVVDPATGTMTDAIVTFRFARPMHWRAAMLKLRLTGLCLRVIDEFEC